MNKKLERNEDKKMIGGVIAGFSDYLKHDVTVWRLGVVALAIITGILPVVVFYLVSWFVMPRQSRYRDDVEYAVVE